MIKIIKKKTKEKMSQNFKSSEFDCKGEKCCCETKIDEKLVEYLQKIRDHFDVSIRINSGYRCATHNKKVGGSANSYHTKGMAADIVVKGVKPAEVAKYAETIGVLGIGLYDTFVHIDTRTSKFFWYSDKQEKRSTFGGENAVKAWQKAAVADGYKLTVDGEWGKECEAVAKKVVCKKQLIGYKNRNLTKIIQKAVGVTADGKFGNDTKNAVIKWQKLLGIKADGVVGYNTWEKILGAK